MVFNMHYGKKDSREEYIEWFKNVAKGKMPGIYRDDGGEAFVEAMFGEKRTTSFWLIKTDWTYEKFKVLYHYEEVALKTLKDLGVKEHECNPTDILYGGVQNGKNYENIKILKIDRKGLSVSLVSGKELSVKIYSLSGKCLFKTGKQYLASGVNSIPLNGLDINLKGMFIIEFISEHKRSVFQYNSILK